MPTYAYECNDCRTGFEVMQKMSDDPLTKCDDCGGTLKKKMFPVGIVFKGSGFYVNDYASKGESAKAAADSAPAAKAADTSAVPPTATESKTESKPEAKAETKPAAAPSTPAASAPASGT